MSTELDKIVSKLAVECGTEANMGVIFEPHEVERGDMIVFRDTSEDPSVRVMGVCMANEKWSTCTNCCIRRDFIV